MASISFTIPDTKLPGIVDAFCTRFNYDVNKNESETRNQFTRRILVSKIKSFIANVYREAQEMAIADIDIADIT